MTHSTHCPASSCSRSIAFILTDSHVSLRLTREHPRASLDGEMRRISHVRKQRHPKVCFPNLQPHVPGLSDTD